MWAYKSGLRKAYTMVSDFAPGKDAEAAFQDAFKKAGGEIVGAVRMPVANPYFSAFVQRAKDLSPESIFIFVPGGAQPAALGKAFAERGIDPNKIKIIGTGRFPTRAPSRTWVMQPSALSRPGTTTIPTTPTEQGFRGGL